MERYKDIAELAEQWELVCKVREVEARATALCIDLAFMIRPKHLKKLPKHIRKCIAEMEEIRAFFD